MAKKALRLGVVGAGSIAQRAPLLHFSVGDVKDRVVLGAVCDPVPGRAKAAAAKFGVPEHYDDFATMLKNADIDMVTLCSPIGLHAAQGLAALKAGKHLHANKTITTTKQECDLMIAEAKKRKLRIVAAPSQMLRPQNIAIRKLIRDGAIGRLVYAAIGGAFERYHEEEGVRTGKDVLSNVNPAWYFKKPGGGPLYDITVYGLHSLTGVLGPAKRVTALTGQIHKTREFAGQRIACDADDNTFLLLDFGNGATAFVYGAATGWLIPSLDFPTYYGTTGSIEQTKLNGKPIEYPGRAQDKEGSGINLTEHVKGTKNAGLGEEHIFEDIMQLARWVREGIPSVVTAEHARHVVEIIESGFRAARTGRTQPLTTTF